MRKFIFMLLATVLGVCLLSHQPARADGGDLFPWPWGTECPFPWQEIQGIYQIKSVKPGSHSGHVLRVALNESNNDSGLEFLSMEEYDHQGRLYAKGQGYAQENEKVVKGLLSQASDDKSFTVMVRSYAKDRAAGCSSDLVTAVTFCPLRGKKCMSDMSYILERM